MPTEPSFYIHVPTRIDPSAAPAEKDALAVLVPVGHLRDMAINIGIRAQDWPAMVNTARETVIRTVEARTGASLRSHIIHEIVNSPTTWKEKFNLDKGAILGLSHSFFNVLSFRPKIKHPSIGQLYFVGASTQPGTGVPICLAGSKLTSEQVLGDYGMHKPWDMEVEEKEVRAIDRVRQPLWHTLVHTSAPLWSTLILVVVLLLMKYFPEYSYHLI
jgi:phytoene desaturase (3,4-didehydrolycopene-forming)